jgi:hypothetical protein
VNGAIAAVIACGVFVAWAALVCLIGPEGSPRRLVRVSRIQRFAWATQDIAAAFALLAPAAARLTRSMQALALAFRGHDGHGRRSLECGVERTFRDDSA